MNPYLARLHAERAGWWLVRQRLGLGGWGASDVGAGWHADIMQRPARCQPASMIGLHANLHLHPSTHVNSQLLKVEVFQLRAVRCILHTLIAVAAAPLCRRQLCRCLRVQLF